MSEREFELMTPDEDGWSDWVHPLPGYLTKCCDCGLVHEMEFAIVPNSEGATNLNDGETAEQIAIFRARRA